MKKLKYISIILIVLLFLVSCIGNKKSLSDDEVSDQVSKSFNKLDSVS